MKNLKLSSAILSAAMLVSLAGAGLAQSAAPGPDTKLQSYDAHTEPNARSKMNFSTPGVVFEVLVKEGDVVKKDQPLIRLDDRQDKLLFEALKLEGDSTLKIEAAEADLAQKRVELEKKKKIFAGGASSQLEVDEAQVAVKIREIQVGVETMTRQQKALESDRQAVKLVQMQLLAPFDGIVEKIDLKVGETPETQRFAASVVNNQTVWVNVYLPTNVAGGLKEGDSLDVKYRDTGSVVKGKVIMRSPVADAASETRLVRLELANPTGLPSGLSVTVMAGQDAPQAATGTTAASTK